MGPFSTFHDTAIVSILFREINWRTSQPRHCICTLRGATPYAAFAHCAAPPRMHRAHAHVPEHHAHMHQLSDCTVPPRMYAPMHARTHTCLHITQHTLACAHAHSDARVIIVFPRLSSPLHSRMHALAHACTTLRSPTFARWSLLGCWLSCLRSPAVLLKLSKVYVS